MRLATHFQKPSFLRGVGLATLALALEISRILEVRAEFATEDKDRVLNTDVATLLGTSIGQIGDERCSNQIYQISFLQITQWLCYGHGHHHISWLSSVNEPSLPAAARGSGRRLRPLPMVPTAGGCRWLHDDVSWPTDRVGWLGQGHHEILGGNDMVISASKRIHTSCGLVWQLGCYQAHGPKPKLILPGDFPIYHGCI